MHVASVWDVSSLLATLVGNTAPMRRIQLKQVLAWKLTRV